MKEFATLLFNVERFKKVYADKAALRIKNGKPATILDAMQLADQARTPSQLKVSRITYLPHAAYLKACKSNSEAACNLLPRAVSFETKA